MVVRAVVIGAGFGGLGAARALRDVGAEVTVLERSDAVGGVWRDNTYPHAACDVPSPLYSWSWAPNPSWERRYGRQPEILAYLQETARREGLLDLVHLGADVVSVVLDETTEAWRVTTAEQTTYDADVVVTAVGQLANPVIPDLPGIADFVGPAFHSARWRHDVDLTGLNVAVIGTGASAIQFVPGIVDDVASLRIFQRSAPYVVPKPDQAYGPRYRRAFLRHPRTLATERAAIFAFGEQLNASLTGRSPVGRPFLAALRAVWRLHLRRGVSDPALRRRLTPEDPIGCKRILFSNDWYAALDHEHVEVHTDSVSGIEVGGVRTEHGTLHPADVLIWGTGFAATRFLDGIDVRGVGGVDLHAQWSGGARAHLGVSVPGFPNLMCVYGPNTNLGGSSIIAMMEAQAAYVAQVAAEVGRRREQGLPHLLDVREGVADGFDTEMQDRLADSTWAACTSWYREADGRITTNWPGTVTEYRKRLAEVDFSELEPITTA